MSPDAADANAVLPWQGWDPEGQCSAGFSDAILHTPPFALGNYSFCSDLDSDGFVSLGDAIMAIFPKQPEDALKAAIEMQEVFHKYNQSRQKKKRAPLKIGIGLHTGSLIMGIIGDKERMDAATIADTVNTASRIESLTKHYGVSILLSEDSLDKIENREAFHLRHLGQVLVKGKKEPVGIYECFDGDEPETIEQKL